MSGRARAPLEARTGAPEGVVTARDGSPEPASEEPSGERSLTGLRVAYLVSCYPAPSHTFIRREVEELRRRGAEVHTFSLRRAPADQLRGESERREDGRTWYVLPANLPELLRTHARALRARPEAYLSTLVHAVGERGPNARGLLWSLFYFTEAVRLAEELERRTLSHLHVHFANSGAAVGMLACRFLGIDFSLTLHGISDYEGAVGQTLAGKIDQARFAACASSFVRCQAMRRIPPRLWAKLFISRCGVDTEMFARAPRGPSNRRRRLVSVGRLSPEKGQLDLVHAFAALVARDVDAELVLVGGGPLHEPLEREVMKLGIADRVVFRGWASEGEVLTELARADLFVLASVAEGLPVVIMEALAMAVPVVAPCIAGIPELIEHERSGLLFYASDRDGLATEMERGLTDDELRHRLMREGATRVTSLHTMAKVVEPLVQRLRRRGPRDTAPRSKPTG